AEAAFFHRTCGAKAAFGEALDIAPLLTDFIVETAGPPLRSRPTIMDKIENDAVDVEEFHLVLRIVPVIGLAHEPLSASKLDPLARAFDIVDPDAEMVEAHEILAFTLRRRVRFEIEQRQA